MMSKRQTIVLSLASLASSFSILAITTFLLVTDNSFNLISNPNTASKIVCTISFCFFAIKYVISNMHEQSLFQEKPRAQIVIIIKSIALLAIVSLTFHCVAVLFGAPLFESVTETFHFAVLMTTLTALPCCLAAGPKLDKWIDIFTHERDAGLETIVYLASLGALLGGWLGAVPIPLDWDRPWQNWPITCSVGCISGYSVGLFLASLYLPHQYKLLLKPKSV